MRHYQYDPEYNPKGLDLLQRITVILCGLVIVMAISILIFAGQEAQKMNHPILESYLIETTATETNSTSETSSQPTTEETEPTEIAEEPVVNLQENLRQWLLDNEGLDHITIWKKTDKFGKVLIALRRGDEVLVTFEYQKEKYNWLRATYEEWTLCDDIFEETSTQDILDCAFTGYHEVTGWDPENVQVQVSVLINRQKCVYFPNTIRGIIVQESQYYCHRNVVARNLKPYISSAQKEAEEQDLERCCRQVLLVFANEVIEEVPYNVVFAAGFPQGRGIWKIINGTYYCYL